MRLPYTYTNYPYSKAATRWSRFRNRLGNVGAVLFILLIMYGLRVLFSKVFGFDDKYILSLILAVAVVVGFLLFCKRREKICAAYDLEKARVNRPLTPEEKKQIRAKLKTQKNAQTNPQC